MEGLTEHVCETGHSGKAGVAVLLFVCMCVCVCVCVCARALYAFVPGE